LGENMAGLGSRLPLAEAAETSAHPLPIETLDNAIVSDYFDSVNSITLSLNIYLLYKQKQ